MKYIDELIQEAEEINTRFKESKELILCLTEVSKLDKMVHQAMIKKYNMIISSVLVLEDFLRELKECSGEEEIIGLMIRAKGK